MFAFRIKHGGWMWVNFSQMIWSTLIPLCLLTQISSFCLHIALSTEILLQSGHTMNSGTEWAITVLKNIFYSQSGCISMYYLQLTIQACALNTELFTSTCVSPLYIHSKEYSTKSNQFISYKTLSRNFTYFRGWVAEK